MKQIKSIIVSCFAIICVARFGSVFTSCNNDDDLLLAGDSQTEQVSPLVQDSVKAVTRSNTPYGAIFVLEMAIVKPTLFTIQLDNQHIM